MRITQATFDQAVEIIRPAVERVLGTDLVDGEKTLFLVAGTVDDKGSYEVCFGDREGWQHPFNVFARRKAGVCERTGKPSGHVLHRTPWLLEEGDPLYAGGVIEDGLIVASSGL